MYLKSEHNPLLTSLKQLTNDRRVDHDLCRAEITTSELNRVKMHKCSFINFFEFKLFFSNLDELGKHLVVNGHVHIHLAFDFFGRGFFEE